MSNDDFAIQAENLGKRFGSTSVLRDCTFSLPRGRVAALVGANGAGKSTLMWLALGLRRPTEGRITVLGHTPGDPGPVPGTGFMAQDKPLYSGFSVDEILRAGRSMNDTWDDTFARRLLDDTGIDPRQRIRRLSGGQRTRVALIAALAKRPELIILDEPVADLDPLARKEVMSTLLTEVTETGMTVLMSSHVIAELEDVCDHLILLTGGGIGLAGDIDELRDTHRIAIGPAGEQPPVPADQVLETSSTPRQTTVLLHNVTEIDDPQWQVHQPGLDEIVLSRMREERNRRPEVPA